jgi:CRISPR-associated protein Cmr3
VDLLVVKLRPLESLMLRGSGEFDPSSRGVHTHAISLAIPRPSTFLGMLFSNFMPKERKVSESCLSVSSWRGLLEDCYVRLLDSLGIEAIRGPFIIKEDKLFIPLMLKEKLLLADYHQAKYYLLKKYDDVLEQYFTGSSDIKRLYGAMKLIEQDIENLEKNVYLIEPQSVELTGVHLISREVAKTVKEGYMYTARYTAYPQHTEIAFIVALRKEADELKALSGKAIKFGGEGRAARLFVSDRIDKPDIVSMLTSTETFKYAALISPAPLDHSDYSKIKAALIGRYATIGLGFSIAKKRRKPITPCLGEGSVVKVDKAEKDKLSTLRYGLYSLLSITRDNYKSAGRLGFASFVPLNMPS